MLMADAAVSYADELLADLLQVNRDSCISSEEEAVPLSQLKLQQCAPEGWEFAAVSAADNAACIRHPVQSGFMVCSCERSNITPYTCGDLTRSPSPRGSVAPGLQSPRGSWCSTASSGQGSRATNGPFLGHSSTTTTRAMGGLGSRMRMPQPAAGERLATWSSSPTGTARSSRAANSPPLRPTAPGEGTSVGSGRGAGRRSPGAPHASIPGAGASRFRYSSPSTGSPTVRVASNRTSTHAQSDHCQRSSPWGLEQVSGSHRVASGPATSGSPRPTSPLGQASTSTALATVTSRASSLTRRGRSPKGRSPKSSPEVSLSPRGCLRPQRPVFPPTGHCRSFWGPRPASPTNPHSDYDLLIETSNSLAWHRFEARVGVADRGALNWPSGCRARFQLIDPEAALVLWESAEAHEPWAPTELCSVLLAPDESQSRPGDGVEGAEIQPPSKGSSVRRLLLRVQCGAPPDGAMWIEPTVTLLKAAAAASAAVKPSRSLVRTAKGEAQGGPKSPVRWREVLRTELVLEVVSGLDCKDAARLLTAGRALGIYQQFAWHIVFLQNFGTMYQRYFLRPLKGIQRPVTFPAQLASPPTVGRCTFAHGFTSPSASSTLHSRLVRPLTSGSLRPGASPPRPGRERPGQAPGPASPWLPSRVTSASQPLAVAPEVAGPSSVPQWAVESFNWRQICRRFHLSQLFCASINFQLFNGTTPPGFVKDSGDTLQPGLKSSHGLGFGSVRCGWNVPLGTEHFLSCPSAVVAHRSPLGVAGVPPSVATVRGTAGPEPLAMTPMVSEKDSSVVLPTAAPGQVRPQWMLEVEPGQYLVIVTVGDRNVGFAAHLEVCGQPLFSGDWIEAGTFKSRCQLVVTQRGVVTVGPSWARFGGCPHGAGCREDGADPSDPARLRHDSPSSPGGGSSPPVPPRQGPTRAEALARGTRLVSVRVVSAALAREVERERRSALVDLSQKVAEAKQRLETLRQVQLQVELGPLSVQVDREVHRAAAKLQELQAQKALKLFSLVAMCRRVTHPYIYLNGDASSSPPGEGFESFQLSHTPLS